MNEKITDAGDAILAKLRDLTDRNAHTEARIQAVLFYSNAYAINNRGDALAWKLNPFQPILAALRKLAEQHERAGSLSPSMLVVRLQLYKLAEEIADAEGLAPAVASIRAAL